MSEAHEVMKAIDFCYKNKNLMEFDMKRVLILGSSGFIGGALVRKCMNKNLIFQSY